MYKVYIAMGRNATQAGVVLGKDRRFVGRKVQEYEKKLNASSRTN
jgi:hypothetical protein